MAHLGLKISPIGQGEFQKQNEMNNNEEEIWTVPLNRFGRNKIPVGNASNNLNGKTPWANKPNSPSNLLTSKRNKTNKNNKNNRNKTKNNKNAWRKRNNSFRKGNNKPYSFLRLENL